ncbi:FAD binding domain-containing protein [Sphingomonas sp. S2-65]|uniref:FAD binding domain-containing protein n=1 Tax=Sphingomonas sp. S2-65 TaxID=2903960 RepID=UPI001F3E89DF|nr:xanthine dehydrogenase family protein subunit M [Sphingomonas sp. S2-65]UYY59257.1 xanthine dehydrogenase family protein subunit M [Sphingomonas sp. S2-65]UYY59270.1 xanthine dehydrogenase family protein subunit M [Sphingomonas sp. S2-65]
MNPVTYLRAGSFQDAAGLASGDAAARLLGGGTNLIDLMRKGIEQPTRLVDVSMVSTIIEPSAAGGLMIGASARNSAVAAHPIVRERYPMLARAVLAGASAQIRNMATVGGNLMQRTRCLYFQDAAGSRCNKRVPGSGCDAIGGFNRYHAVLGASPDCIATHPSDMCVALVALDAVVHVAGQGGARVIPLVDFHRLPGDRPDQETMLSPGEVIVAVELPAPTLARSSYRKVRDRASYAFALVSVAAGLTMQDGRIDDVRIAFGGIGTKPWRALRAEAFLRGNPATPDAFAAAAAAELAEATPLPGNAFKIELAARTLAAVLGQLAGDDR